VTPKAQTPLVRFVVDLLWTYCGFVVESTANPRHLDMSKSCGFVVDLSKNLGICCGFVVDLLYTTCCTANPQQKEQVEFELNAATWMRRQTVKP
jgi:hypothetical protein